MIKFLKINNIVKFKQMKKLLSTSVICMFACVLHAQRITNEQPAGLSLTLQNKAIVQTLPKPNMSAIHAEDAVHEAFNIALYTERNAGRSDADGKQQIPLRFAYGVPVNFTLTNSGTWNSLPNGDRLWQLKVRIPDALSLHAYYDQFYLPAGAKFFVYSEETGQSIGAIISEIIGGSFKNPRKYATPLIYGETIVFEYWQPVSVRESAVISISRVDYGYRYVDSPFMESTRDVGDAASCHININCPLGAPWQNHKRAVARVQTNGPSGSSWCSGALINNTNNDLTPYFLTADHCLKGQDASDNPDASQFIFYWNLERSGCDNSTPYSSQFTTGATVKANSSGLVDFALLLLDSVDNPVNRQDIAPPYFLGWSRSSSTPSSGVGIHHPKGDVKKISLTSDIRKRLIFDVNYWRVEWLIGSTEPGSSGSPLLNDNGLIIGQLGWGNASCGFYVQGFDGDNYGRLDISWDSNSDILRQLKHWLAPGLSNPPLTLAGISATPGITGSNIVCNSTTYTVDHYQVDQWSFTGSSAFNFQPNGNSATVSIPANTPYSFGTIKAKVQGIEYSKTIENCAIKGPSSSCLSDYYELTSGPATWSMSSGSQYFKITPVGGSNMVKVTSDPSGKTGTLTAVANGKTYNLNISSCLAVVAGPPTVCSSAPPSTFVLSMGSASYWTASGSVRIVSYNSTSCQVEATAYDGSQGIVTAVFSDGGTASTNVIASCISGPKFVCDPTIYTPVNGQVTKWTLEQTGSVFSLTPNGNSATVSATANAPYSTATLKATMNGGAIYPKTIVNCAITGSSTLNYGLGYSYYLTTGESATWSLVSGSNYFSMNIVNNGTLAVVAALAPTGGTGTIQAVVGSKTYTMNIQANLASINGPSNVCSTGSPVTFTLSTGSAYSWTVGGPSLKVVSYTSTSCTVQATANDGTSGAVIALFAASGAITKPLIATCGKGGNGEEPKLDAYVTAYPNPSSDILNIEIDAAAHALELQSKNITTVPTYEVRLLDNQAISRHQTSTKGGTVQFNLSILPIGVYYLLVHDGISAPLLRQIVVEH